MGKMILERLATADREKLAFNIRNKDRLRWKDTQEENPLDFHSVPWDTRKMHSAKCTCAIDSGEPDERSLGTDASC